MSVASKISDLGTNATVASTDVLVVIDDPSGTPASTKATVLAVSAAGVAALPHLDPVATDELVFISDPGGTPTAGHASVAALRAASGGVGVLTDNIDGTDTQVIGTTYVKITTFDGSTSAGTITASHANDNITVTVAQTYRISFSCSFSGSNNTIYTCAMHLNGNVDTSGGFVQTVTSSGFVACASFEAALVATANDVIDVRIKADAPTSDFVVYTASLAVVAV